jgi:hypothetical protein
MQERIMYHEQFWRAEAERQVLLVPLVRAWHAARDGGRATMPALARLLEGEERPILAPVIDGLVCMFEAALGRPIGIGRDGQSSDDERLLVALLQTPALQPPGTDSIRGLLDGALRSARVMLTMTAMRAGRPVNA